MQKHLSNKILYSSMVRYGSIPFSSIKYCNNMEEGSQCCCSISCPTPLLAALGGDFKRQLLQTFTICYRKDYGRSLIIFIPSSAENAFNVLVLTFPADPTLSIIDITASSFGASIIIITSYSPKV